MLYEVITDPGAAGGEHPGLDPTDRQDTPGKGQLAGHGDITTGRAIAEQRHQGGGDGHPGRWPVLRNNFV